jgi:hypothetical protein
MRSLIPMILAILLTGCRTQVLFVDPGTTAIRLGRARGEYFVQNSKGEWIRTTGKLPVGWYAIKEK